MTGKIVKGIAGFYYVDVVESGIYECKAKGIFRKEKKKPLVGDWVRIEVLDETEREANLVEILPRENELIRPAVANVDQAMLIVSLDDPVPNQTLVDRFLVMMEDQGVSVFLVFNKADLVDDENCRKWKRIYEGIGYAVFFCSTKTGEGLDEIRAHLEGKTTVLAGGSGVGKSSFTNRMQTKTYMETGGISKKLGRGRHTTRHSELLPVSDNTWLCDTPGFTSLFIIEKDKEELRWCYPEFMQYEGKCRFQGCVHVNEPDCKVKEAVEEGLISQERYQSYVLFYEELKEKEKRRY